MSRLESGMTSWPRYALSFSFFTHNSASLSSTECTARKRYAESAAERFCYEKEERYRHEVDYARKCESRSGGLPVADQELYRSRRRICFPAIGHELGGRERRDRL